MAQHLEDDEENEIYSQRDIRFYHNPPDAHDHYDRSSQHSQPFSQQTYFTVKLPSFVLLIVIDMLTGL